MCHRFIVGAETKQASKTTTKKPVQKIKKKKRTKKPQKHNRTRKPRPTVPNPAGAQPVITIEGLVRSRSPDQPKGQCQTNSSPHPPPIHHTPYTIHHTPYTIHHTPYTIHHGHGHGHHHHRSAITSTSTTSPLTMHQLMADDPPSTRPLGQRGGAWSDVRVCHAVYSDAWGEYEKDWACGYVSQIHCWS